MQSLELTFDDAADARVRAGWTRLADAGLPSQARHTGDSNRPHVTLLVRPELPLLDDPGAGRLPLELRLGPLLVLGRAPRLVVARSIVPTRDLLDLHAELHDRVGPGDDALFSAPGSWTPHITLARGVGPELLPRLVATLAGDEESSARAVGIRHWDGVARVETPLV